QACRGSCFLPQSLGSAFLLEVGADQFDGDQQVERRIPGLPHLAHTAFAKDADQLVLASNHVLGLVAAIRRLRNGSGAGVLDRGLCLHSRDNLSVTECSHARAAPRRAGFSSRWNLRELTSATLGFPAFPDKWATQGVESDPGNP